MGSRGPLLAAHGSGRPAASTRARDSIDDAREQNERSSLAGFRDAEREGPLCYMAPAIESRAGVGGAGASLTGGAVAQVGISVFLSAVAADTLRARRLPTTHGVVGFYGGTDVLFVVFLGAALLLGIGLSLVTG